MTIVVTGATGRVGSNVVRGLLSAGVSVRALVRDPARAAIPAGARPFTGDLREPGSLGRALAGARSLFLYAASDHPEELATVVREAGVEQVVVLSTIDATNPHAYADHNRRRHVAVELATAAAGVRYTFLRPGAFAANALRFWGPAIAKGDRVPIPFPEAQQAPIDELDIARVAVRALTSDALDGQAVVLTGPESLTQREQLAIVAAASERPFTLETERLEDARLRLARCVPSAYVELLLAQWADESGVPATVTDAVERITGRPAATFADWSRRNARSFESVSP